MYSLDFKTRPQIQGVSNICTSVVLCENMSLSNDMGLIFGRVVNWATANL